MEDTFQAIDTNDDGYMTVNDFVKYMKHHEYPYWSEEKHVKQLFRFADQDRDSKLSSPSRVCEPNPDNNQAKAQQKISKQHLEKLLEQMHTNHDGHVTHTEMSEFSERATQTRQLERQFQIIDHNHDGAISFDELHEWFVRVCRLKNWTLQQTGQLFAHIDLDHDAQICFEDFRRFAKHNEIVFRYYFE
eukprot:CAMPEP_0117447254 /NCGR_PEP_ID=MMETSP0759-20121206/6775_1 /TAXON_ID=63605 /ORGANISM="Percolomonas cosmopolitus, Strain WS" /LENGTH=188 /DNA_ID=CAMNT_0005239573 /DNA_START=366 /DNA_END=933 /DNA_ORIENTATION=-